jgi:hypothetical protein
MNLIDVTQQFPNDEECLKYIEQMRWPDGVVRCPVCGCDRISRITRKSTTKNVLTNCAASWKWMRQLIAVAKGEA